MAGGVLVAVVSGCSTTEPGSPTGTGSTTPSNGGSTSSTMSSVANSSPSTAQNTSGNPCDLLSSSDVSTLGLGTGKRRNIHDADACVWTASGKYGLTVGYSKNGLAGAQGDKVDVGKHEARQVIENSVGGSCAVTMGTSPNSSVLVVVANLSGPVTDSCPQAVTIAKIIDPKLP
jgi:hypothetical protein